MEASSRAGGGQERAMDVRAVWVPRTSELPHE